LTITITIAAETGAEAREKMLSLIGDPRPGYSVSWHALPNDQPETGFVEQTPDSQAAQAETPTPTRERGKPSPGKSKRTKAEIAEDDAADAADAETEAQGGYTDRMTEEFSAAQNVDSEDDAAQDAADEQAEVDAGRDPANPLTGDDLKNAMGLYVSKFTLEATKEDGPVIFNRALGKPPAGQAGWRVSLVEEAGQEALRAAVGAWTAAAQADDRVSKTEG
jgi:hypothetical protein